jgi:hypothetical protein
LENFAVFGGIISLAMEKRKKGGYFRKQRDRKIFIKGKRSMDVLLGALCAFA